MPLTDLYLGLMSGTSLDGVDAALVDFSQPRPNLLATHWLPYPEAIKTTLLALHEPGPNELDQSCCLANQLAELYAEATHAALAHAGVNATAVRAIGCHGQTVRHQPARGYTLQINNAARLAELTGITTVADFRSRDIAAGGQGAPLVPAFHAHCFGDPEEHRVIVNIGGISNLTDLPPEGIVRGWDCGPGNLLMDAWTRRCFDCAYDAGGAIAARGRLDATLLSRLLAHPFLSAPPPKSTGREDFSLDGLLALTTPAAAPEDILTTLTELTARGIADAIKAHCPGTRAVYLCGGGAHNQTLVTRLSSLLPAVRIEPTDALGIAVDWVEAAAFAWLAKRTLEGQSGNLPAVTGARGERILGAIYPA
ncbi:MAG: anhydro-N-acetylmuramic acid kinase [Betaproteobacteria bacterium]|nr:anhydro-N-acetylmuramic acid kinase [Betaproteobacteria bacterium]